MIIKVCGLRQSANIRDVECAGADWIGFILHPKSPRYLHDLPDYLPRTARVGVFVNPELDRVAHFVKLLGLTHIQLHGDESPLFCRQIVSLLGDISIIKALTVSGPKDIERAEEYASEEAVSHLLFDTKVHQQSGGTGQQFDWTLLQSYSGLKPFLLSGGIGPQDALRISQLQFPGMVGIDINSRFETAPGMKDIKSIEKFIQEIRHYEQDKPHIQRAQ